MPLSGGEVILLIVLILLGGLLIWERTSASRERMLLREETLEERMRALSREGDLLDRLTIALAKPIPAWPRNGEPAPHSRAIYGDTETGIAAPIGEVPQPPTPDELREAAYPSMGLNDDQQELAQRLMAQGKGQGEIWQALMQQQEGR